MDKFVTVWVCAPIMLLVLHAPADSQVLSFGAKVGVPVTTAYTTVFVPDGGASADETRFVVGPTIEVHLPYRLSFEIDALWRRSSFTSISAHTNLNYKSSVNDWQVPFLLKYAVAPVPGARIRAPAPRALLQVVSCLLSNVLVLPARSDA